MLLGWLPDYSLKMPVRRFFCLLREARLYHGAKVNSKYMELTSIAVCGRDGSGKYSSKLSSHYQKKVMSYFNRDGQKKSLADNKIAAAKLLHIFRGAGQNG